MILILKRLNRSSAMARKRLPTKPTLLRRLLSALRFKKPSNRPESNHHTNNHSANNNRHRQPNKPINNSLGSNDTIKKTVSLQVPDRAAVAGELSSSSSQATAGQGTNIPSSPNVPPKSSSVANSSSVISQAARRLSDIRLPKKFFPSAASSPKRPAAIELEDDDVPVRMPPRLSPHSFHNE